ncbi:MAG TPA: hypothetical protein VLF59_01795 [Candidatus Saccharimonadales bacterium]|nr:hypothetical protein [Candidatus Saccharimonadales bacterium]
MASIKRMVNQANRGRISAIEAVDAALDTGEFVAIGGAVARRRHRLAIPVSGASSGPRSEATEYGWRFSSLDEYGGIRHMVIASTLAGPALWGAFGGNRNICDERKLIGKQLTPPDRRYPFGTYGHGPSATPGEDYILAGHEDLLTSLEDKNTASSGQRVGNVALIQLKDSMQLLPPDILPDDPGHVAFAHDLKPDFDVPVHYGDFGGLVVSSFFYNPVQL